MTPTSPWWSRERHEDRRPRLLARARIAAGIRAWFHAEGFIEVEPACLQVSPGNETHVHAFKTTAIATDLTQRDLYLHTSPEFAMKKLLAAGEEKIFALGPVFRNREHGPLHAHEFTMLEWYRVGAPYRHLWSDCHALLTIAANAANASDWSYRDLTCDPRAELDALTLDAAFTRYASFAVADIAEPNDANRATFAARAAAAGISLTSDDTWSDIFSRVLTEKIEPKLGAQRPIVLHDYPLSEAALARATADDPHIAERFELYVCGVELANGFGELTDAQLQRRRFTAAMDDKQRLYGERYPIDEDFLSALASMPPSSGCALGFDRLVMLATGATRVDQVIWTPCEHPGTRR